MQVAAATAGPELPRANRVIAIPDFELDGRLTPEQVDFFETYGFIRFKRFVPRERALALYQAVLEVDRALVAEGREQINGVPLIFGTPGRRHPVRPAHLLRLAPARGAAPLPRRIRGSPRSATSPAPTSAIAEDERDGMVVNRFRNEPGAKYKRLGWHTDSLRDLFYLEKPRRYLNVGFYFTDSPIEVGGLRVLPCTHNQSIASMLTQKIHFVDDAPDPGELAITAEAGDLTFHDGRMWHRTAHRRAHRRRERALRLVPAADERPGEAQDRAERDAALLPPQGPGRLLSAARPLTPRARFSTPWGVDALLTDLYQLTMAAGYFHRGLDGRHRDLRDVRPPPPAPAALPDRDGPRAAAPLPRGPPLHRRRRSPTSAPSPRSATR